MTDIKPIILPGMNSSGPIIIAGPCSAETEAQTMSVAERLSASGIRIFRAGVWKPRTMPGGFEGAGALALEWLRKVKEQTGMCTMTEVATRTHVELALDAGIDLLWIGARTSANPFAVQEIADTIKELNADIPVFVKNPVSPDLELWIGALYRLYNAGIRRIGAIHRGFSTSGIHIYRNMPQWHIPTELRLRFPKLPIVCDPSHIAGQRDLVGDIAQQALDMGFDGLIIESHCKPDEAWSDAAQQLTPDALSALLQNLNIREQQPTTEIMTLLRHKIDAIDDELIDILARRMDISREIGRYKKEHNIPVLQAERYNDILRSRIATGQQHGMSADFLRTLLLAVHDESVRQQINIVKQ